MNALIGIVTCDKNQARAQACRDMWVPELIDRGFDVKFFLGKQERETYQGEVFLDCPDDYEGLPAKVKAICGWAVEQKYETVLKVDDDSYINSDRLVVPENAKYAGLAALRRGLPNYPDGLTYCSGGGYWLRDEAIQLVADAPLVEGESVEDRWVGSVMKQHNIQPTKLEHYIAPRKSVFYRSDFIVLMRWGT